MAVSLKRPIVCVDIGGTSTKAGVLDPEGRLHNVNSIPTMPDAESYCEALVRLIEVVRHAPVEGNAPKVNQLGVAVAGFLDPLREGLLYNSNLAWLEGFPLRSRLSQQLPDFQVELEIDSNAATMAECRLGSGRSSKRFLCVTCGTGLGVGMAIDGAPLRFAYGCLGDIGHTIVLRDGPLCTCGGKGCAEIMISAPVLANQYRTAIGSNQPLALRDVIENAQRGDAKAISVLETAGNWLGVAIASMANTLFPDHIAIAGGLSAGGDFVLKSAERVFRETACIFARSMVTFTRAELGSTATLIGAAWPFWAEEN